MGAKLAAGLGEIAAALGVPHTINRVGSMWTFFFTPTPVTDLTTATTADAAKFGRFFWAMMDRGIYLPCSQFEAAFISGATTDADIDATLHAARESLALVA